MLSSFGFMNFGVGCEFRTLALQLSLKLVGPNSASHDGAQA